jgi:hypothetical protein
MIDLKYQPYHFHLAAVQIHRFRPGADIFQ